MAATAHVEPERRVGEKMIFSRRNMVDFSCRRCYKLILWLKYVLLGLDAWLAGRKIALLSENDSFKKTIFWALFRLLRPASPLKTSTNMKHEKQAHHTRKQAQQIARARTAEAAARSREQVVKAPLAAQRRTRAGAGGPIERGQMGRSVVQ